MVDRCCIRFFLFALCSNLVFVVVVVLLFAVVKKMICASQFAVWIALAACLEEMLPTIKYLRASQC